MLMRTFIALIAVLAAGFAAAQAYRWVDEDGVVHFSDVPVEGAELIQLPDDRNRSRTRTQSSLESLAVTLPTTNATDEPQVAPQPAFRYETLEVVAPAPEETLWNIEGVLNVALRVTPSVRAEDQVRVYFDGEERTVSGTNFQIEEVYRGVHNIQAEIVDSTGHLMIRSLPNRFYVQQNTIANPRR